CQTINYPGRDRVISSHYDNRNRLGCLLCCADCWWCRGDKDIDVEFYEFGHETWDTIPLPFKVAILNQDIFPLNITEITQPLLECFVRGSRIAAIANRYKVSYSRKFLWLLRLNHSPTNPNCGNDFDNPHQFSILDFRFPIVGWRIPRSHPGSFVHLFFA